MLSSGCDAQEGVVLRAEVSERQKDRKIMIQKIIISGNSLLKWSNVNSNEKSLLATNVYQLMFNLGVPLYMYGKNISIFQHLIHDLLEEFLGIENIPTCFPKRTSMIYPSNQKMKISQKLQSKSEPLAHSTSMSPPPCSTKKMTNKIVVSQVPQETFDKVNEEQNQNYPPMEKIFLLAPPFSAEYF